MQRYIAFRFFQAMLALWAVSVIVFSLARLTGDPLDVMLSPFESTQEDRDRLAAYWGLDKPMPIQYWVFLTNALRGDFGRSWTFPDQTAMGVVMQRLPATIQLASFALVISAAIALPIGVIAAVKKDTPFDYLGKILALLGQSLPGFWLAIVLMWIFAAQLGWFPVSGRGGIHHMVLPAIAMGWYSVAAVMRLTRSAMLEVMDSEYVKLARIKGVTEGKVVWKHGLRNAAIVPVTYYGIIVGSFLTGSVAIEVVFSWPGTGLLAVQSIQTRDFQVVQSVVLVFAVVFILSNLVVDILYAYLDPRIRYNK